jgi:hypothetical protein
MKDIGRPGLFIRVLKNGIVLYLLLASQEMLACSGWHSGGFLLPA